MCTNVPPLWTQGHFAIIEVLNTWYYMMQVYIEIFSHNQWPEAKIIHSKPRLIHRSFISKEATFTIQGIARSIQSSYTQHTSFKFNCNQFLSFRWLKLHSTSNYLPLLYSISKLKITHLLSLSLVFLGFFWWWWWGRGWAMMDLHTSTINVKNHWHNEIPSNKWFSLPMKHTQSSLSTYFI